MLSFAALIDGSPNDAPSLGQAVSLCRAQGASLTVVYPRLPDILPAGAYEFAAAPIDNTAFAHEALMQAEEAYVKACGELPGCRFLPVDVSSAEAVMDCATYHDLILLERLSDAEGPDALLLRTALWDARNAVMVLPQGAMPASFQTVTVAWNGSPQAGRALRAALPLLKKAAKVTILVRQGAEPEDAELKHYLTVHGLANVGWRNYGEKSLSARGWARTLIAELKAEGADLLVMGATGSSMGNIFGFGRATEKIVTASPVPVIMSA